MFYVQLKNDRQVVTGEYANSTLEFGRTEAALDGSSGVTRFVLSDDFVSGCHARITAPNMEQMIITNLSAKNPILLADGQEVPPLVSVTWDRPTLVFWIGKTSVEIQQRELQPTLETIPAPANSLTVDALASWQKGTNSEFNEVKYAQWLETLVSIQRSAAGSADFCRQTAEAAVRMIGFDQALVLILIDTNWEVVGQFPPAENTSPRYSRSILQRVIQERRTYFQSDHQTQSIPDDSLAAASPILNATGSEVIGAVFGFKSNTGPSATEDLTTTHASLLQLLAGTLSLAFARAQQEAETTRLRTKFDQFFTPQLARQIENDVSLLEGRERIVTVMFADLRNFAGLSQGLSPSATCLAITDVLECMTAAVRRHDGVVVDYAGDGLMAIWNAPTNQDHHVDLAAASALEIVANLPAVSAHWSDRISSPFFVGIGIHTGTALVGNVGTSHKFKYGASGMTVNLASRLESATKHVGVSILLTHSSKQLLANHFLTRRLLSICVTGLDDPIQIYEMHINDPSGHWEMAKDIYEKALAEFEQKKWAACCQTILPLMSEYGEAANDLPSLHLAERAIECLKSNPSDFQAILRLTQK